MVNLDKTRLLKYETVFFYTSELSTHLFYMMEQTETPYMKSNVFK